MTPSQASYLENTIRASRDHAHRRYQGPQAGVLRSPGPRGAANTISDAERNSRMPIPGSGTSKQLPGCEACFARLSRGLCGDCQPDSPCVIANYTSADRDYKVGQDLFSLGEPCDTIYNLLEGWVILYNLLEDGRRQILHFALPGAVLGFHPGGGAMMTYGAQALTDIVVSTIPQPAARVRFAACPARRAGLHLGLRSPYQHWSAFSARARCAPAAQAVRPLSRAMAGQSYRGNASSADPRRYRRCNGSDLRPCQSGAEGSAKG